MKQVNINPFLYIKDKFPLPYLPRKDLIPAIKCGVTEKVFSKYFFCFFLWNPQLKTDSAYLLILFSVKDSTTRVQKNSYIIFLKNVSSNTSCIAVEKILYVENQIHKKATEQ